MYGRISEVYQQLFAGDASLVLSHGQSRLVEEFATSILPAIDPEADGRQLDETAGARCAVWLAEHGKRSLLSPAGVGTIDQTLLAVLTSKHQCLRLLGLFRKVLVVDEVHACDAYMQRVLETVLTFHACAGGSAILLGNAARTHEAVPAECLCPRTWMLVCAATLSRCISTRHLLAGLCCEVG
jgi:CRISPR-associated endonuclease/helicase Cas3